MSDPYSILGVSTLASDAEIKTAYRQLVKRYHPDMDPGNQDTLDRFRQIQEAYDQITEETRIYRDYDSAAQNDQNNAWRQSSWAYDNLDISEDDFSDGPSDDELYNTNFPHDDGVQPSSEAEQPRAYEQPSAPKEEVRAKRNAEDVLADFFGGLKSAKNRAFKNRGQDITYHLKISLEEASLGTVKRVRLASGKRFKLKIPPGVKDGQQIRMSGHGRKGSGGGARGDTIIVLRVKDHPYFTYHGSNIHMELPVTVDEAVLGARVSVPTLEGSVVLKIPEGSNTDSVFRLRGRGRPVKDKTDKEGNPLRGDQYISLKVVLPTPSDQQFAKLVRRWAVRNSYDVRDFHHV